MDHYWMKYCLKLALQAKGMTSPNPLVGSVLVKNGKIVGEGYHKKAGTEHAEVHALIGAGEQAKGATLYVNLEPCCHYGKTAPCTEKIIAAEVERVVVAMVDPNPKVAGKGIARLQSAGIEVVTGVCEKEAKKINEVFLKYIITKTPYVLWKTACSLDGKVAVNNGNSYWVTSEKARKSVHQTRAEMDGIMVGSGTILQDDPLLTARPLPEGFKQPTRIILDGRGRIQLSAKIFNSEGSEVLWIVGSETEVGYTQFKNTTVIKSPTKKIDLNWLLKMLGEKNITSLMLEGGQRLVTSFWQQRLVDKVHWYLAPKLVGGDGISVLGELNYNKMIEAESLQNTKVDQLGNDLMLEGYPSWTE